MLSAKGKGRERPLIIAAAARFAGAGGERSWRARDACRAGPGPRYEPLRTSDPALLIGPCRVARLAWRRTQCAGCRGLGQAAVSRAAAS